MPLEVRELNIKITVGDDAGDAPAAGEGAGDNGEEDQIRKIVELVLEALDKRNER
ncbi:hypothetical protein GGR28_002322 [Lewinella aquimaris]|uniref:Uncharacterized protein n=1 Tax=Neolewinella aquimaris TaxID=1835722 RepID=A0A840E8Q0_9BACT|nr:DUF5908 family protein [Neolewinella aquimaris]MBB4079697.1 hypothetical protein [Neolewinella aquimaris]